MDWNPQLADAFTLQGKVVVITGAASGLGQEAARIFALAGAWTALGDVDETGLKQTAAIVAEAGGKCLVRRTDVSISEVCDALADAAFAEWGALDVWINPDGSSLILDEDEFAALELDAETRRRAREAVTKLLALVRQRATPFNSIT